MRTSKEISVIKDDLYEQVLAAANKLVELRKQQVERILSSGIKGLDEVADLADSVEKCFEGSHSGDVYFPSCLVRIEAENREDMPEFTLTIHSRLNAKHKFRGQYTIPVNENIIMSLLNAFVDVLFPAFYYEMADENISALNERIRGICAENDIECKVAFGVSEGDGTILSITDDLVVFGVSVATALDSDKFNLFSDGSEYDNFVVETTIEKLLDGFRMYTTTPMLLKGDMEFINRLAMTKTRKRASRVIRGTYHRNARFLYKVKAGIGYVEETVTVDGEEKKIFALVEKNENGELSVILHPFDVTNAMNVDVDVLAIVEGFPKE